MCGISGIAKLQIDERDQQVLRQMTHALAHRGPDDQGHWHESSPKSETQSGGVALGHRRLSILDLSPRGKQPMLSRCERYVLAFNGEIYNFKELRAEIPEATFETGTDTEVLLEAWKKWGVDCLHKLEGMFAFAMWDREKQKLTLVRDRLGIKPLYYRLQDKELLFSSELRGLLASGRFSPKLERQALRDYLAYQTVHAPMTILKGVFLLEPGHFAEWEGGEWEKKAWWEITRSAQMDAGKLPYEQQKQEIRELFRQAVEKRMVSDVPLGAFLSGGIDSSAVVAMMARAKEGPVDTFSVVFKEKEWDESPWSEMIAKMYNTRHHPILLQPERFLEELPNALNSMDHPSGDGINSYVVSKVTREAGITVALSGLGGDEIFAGYPFFRQLSDIQSKKILKVLPWTLRKGLAGMARVLPGGRRGEKIASVLALKNTSFESIFPVYRRLFSEKNAARFLLNGDQGRLSSERWLDAHAQELNALPLLSRISAAEVENYMQNVLLRDTDQMSMAHALEVRVPFLDHRLISFVLGIGDEQKYPVKPKKLLIEALDGLLPEQVIYRKKMGFTFPWEAWMRSELRSFCQVRMENLEQRGIFNQGEIEGLWKRFLSQDKTVIWPHVWVLVVLEDWLAKNGIET